MTKRIAHIVIGLPVEGPFDYSISDALLEHVVPGKRVLVMFAGRKRVGVVVSLGAKTHFPRLNPILQVLDKEPVFSEAFLKFAIEFSLHFGCTQGEALEIFLPGALRKPRAIALEKNVRTEAPEPMADRTLIFDTGLTKRWDALLPKMREVLARGQGVLCLVPDGSYLNDTVARVAPLVAPQELVVLRHENEKEELERWLKVCSGEARLAVGFISGVFAPVDRLGMIVLIDEESHSYKHDQSPFYHAREAAFLRGRIEGAAVVCVSSAPSVEIWREVMEKKEALTVLKEALPPVKMLDLTNFKMKKDTFLSQPLTQQIEAALKEGKPVLLYIPAAKGVSAVILEAAARFPGADIAGYEKASAGPPHKCDILVATQAVFRYRSSLRFYLSVILDTDWEFHKNDYRAAHGAFALVQHLRQMTWGCVLMQTRHAHNEHLHDILADNYESFYTRELHHRRDAGLPPYAILVALVVRSADPELACAEAKRLYDMFNDKRLEDIGVLEPQQDRSAIVRGKFRYCVMVHGLELKEVMGFVKENLKAFRRKKDVVITVNVNP
ncbi:MAG: hypothetical protein HQL18_04005 [Candidatus Omnitrophica bacterium]|nr:hypothetical protein [Candidatus Omnitrophota bacterium]